VLAVIFEAHLAGNLGVERVILAEPDVQPGLEAATFLSDQDRPARHEVPVVSLYAKTLRVAVASVA
jgi:hypothetical protein